MMSLSAFHRRRHDPPAPEDLAPGSYLTDGRNLFWVSSVIAASKQVLLVLIEDCRTLETRLYASTSYGSLSLQPVPRRTPATPVAGDRPADHQIADDPLAGMWRSRTLPAR